MGNCGALAEIIQVSFSFVQPIIGITMAIFSPVTIILNLLLIISFIATKQVHQNTSNFLITCLSLSDLLNGAISMPVLSSSFFNIEDTKVCRSFLIGQISSSFFNMLSGAVTFLIAIDRYLNMNPNLERRSRLANLFRRPYIYLLLLVLALCVLLISVAGMFTSSIQSTHYAVLNATSGALTLVAVCAMTVMYAKGYLRIRNFTDASPIYREKNGREARPEYVRKLYKSVLVLVIVNISMTAPTCLVSIAMSFVYFVGSPNDYVVACSIYLLVCMLIYLNFSVNSLVIFWFNNTARQWVATKIKCGFVRRRKEAVNIANDVATVPTVQKNPVNFFETKL